MEPLPFLESASPVLLSLLPLLLLFLHLLLSLLSGLTRFSLGNPGTKRDLSKENGRVVGLISHDIQGDQVLVTQF